MHNIEQKIIELVAKETGIDPTLIQPSSTMSDIEVPSISQMEIMFSLEEAFDIEFPEQMEDLSLDGFARTTRKLIAEKDAP